MTPSGTMTSLAGAVVLADSQLVAAAPTSLASGEALPQAYSREESGRPTRGSNLSLTAAQRPPMERALEAFLQQYPSFAETQRLDVLRATEYARLDQQHHIYLDYTGGGLYAESQLHEHMALLTNHVFGNPHSTNPASQAMTDLVERARNYVLDYFQADPEEYEAIFTSNASGALKLVGEAYPFAPGGQYLLTFDNHNSVNGIREFARAKGASFSYIPIKPPDLRADEDELLQQLEQGADWQPKLFAYPAQSNVSGVQHPLAWIELAHEHGWDVLVDCAAFVPTNRLDLSQWHPDFVPLSFYKIFGYPTGIGCLLARKQALQRLHRPWYAGGTLTFSSVIAAKAAGAGFYRTPGAAGFEDGTVNYLDIPAVEIGLKYIADIGIDLIHERVAYLTGWLLDQLTSLRHSNGTSVVHIYGPVTTERRGGTIALNFVNPYGKRFDSYELQEKINQLSMSVRSGCFCNPGVREVALECKAEDLVNCLKDKDRMSYEQFVDVIDAQLAGALRISVGVASNFADVYWFMQFAQTFVDHMP